MGAACGGVWSDKAKELSSALPLPLRREVRGGHTGPQGSPPVGAGRHRHLPPHPGCSPRCTLTSGWWAGDRWLGWTSSGHSPKEGGEQDCCQGNRAPPLSMATAPLDRSPSVPGCSCPGNAQALLAPAASGHPGFGEGGREGQHLQASGSQTAALVGAGGNYMPPPWDSSSRCYQFGAGSLFGVKVPLWCCPQGPQPGVMLQSTQ